MPYKLTGYNTKQYMMIHKGDLLTATHKPLRVLQIIGAMDRAGAETFVMNVYRRINPSRVQFDFLVHTTRTCDYDEEIRARGGHIYSVPEFKVYNALSYRRACDAFFDTHPGYDAVHGHIGSSAPLYLTSARKHGIFSIVHSHSSDLSASPQHLAYKALTYPTRTCADYFLACSQVSGQDRFGRTVSQGPHFAVVNNGIDTGTYAFDSAVRQKYRAELQIADDQVVYGHVGRLSEEKNHPFLFETFKEILAQDPRSILVLVGRGPREHELKEFVDTMGISQQVKFLGIRDDVPQILMTMDAFLFPSIFEGLPLATVEAQASGLPCLFSTALPSLSVITDKTQQLNLREGATAWATRARELAQHPYSNRAHQHAIVAERGFDITRAAQQLTTLYEDHIFPH